MEFHVLLVEDDKVTLKAVEQLLRKCNYKVTCATNGREAITVLTTCRQEGIKVDLILTDILMPEVTGFDLIHEVVHGEAFCDVPVVVMSSQDSQESVIQAFQAGAADYLIKPIRKNEVTTLWQHVWRANKARGTGSADAGVAYHCDGAGAAHIKDSSGGSSSGAATSVLQSTGATTLPSRAATTRHLPSSSLHSKDTVGPSEHGTKYPHRHEAGHGSSHQGPAHAHTHEVPPHSAATTAQQDSSVRGMLSSLRCEPPHQAAGARAFNTSVAVHFDLNPATHVGHLRQSSVATGSTAAAAAGGHRLHAVVGSAAATAAPPPPPPLTGGTSATVISWSHAGPAEAAAAAAATRAEAAGDLAAEAPRKRQRIGSSAPSGRTAAATATAVRTAAVEASQGSRAASASAATITGAPGGRPASGLRDDTASPSRETFMESPSSHTSATATPTSSSMTRNSTGSGSEAEERRHRNQQFQDTAGTPPGGAAAAAAAAAAADGRRGEDAAAGPGLSSAAGGGGGSSNCMYGSSAGVRRTATSAGPLPGHVEASGAPGSATTGLPHPTAAAPQRHGSAAAGQLPALLPPGLQELAALGARRDQQLWTQRALLQQRQQQQQVPQWQVQHQQLQQLLAQQVRRQVELEMRVQQGLQQQSGLGMEQRGMQAQDQHLDSHQTLLQQQQFSQQQSSPPQAQVQQHYPAAAAPEQAIIRERGGSGPGVREAPADGVAAGEGSAHGARPGRSAGGDEGSGPPPQQSQQQPSQAGNGLSLLRHSERSAFTAFTVFLPGKVAAQAASATAVAPEAGGGSGGGVAASRGAIGTAPSLVRPSVLPPPPPPPMLTNAGSSAFLSYTALPPPQGLSMLPPVLPLQTAPRPPHLPTPDSVSGPSPLHATATAPHPGAAASAATLLGHMPYPGLPQPRPPSYGQPPMPSQPPAGSQQLVSKPPVFIPEPVLQLIAHLSGRAAADIPVPEAVTQAPPVVVQKAASAARLAALERYLEKRKHRNFQKKVRYESRKRLAEARPRVRGQFVKSSPAPAGATPAAPAAPGSTADGSTATHPGSVPAGGTAAPATSAPARTLASVQALVMAAAAAASSAAASAAAAGRVAGGATAGAPAGGSSSSSGAGGADEESDKSAAEA